MREKRVPVFCFITGIKLHFARKPVVQLKSKVVLNETMVK